MSEMDRLGALNVFVRAAEVRSFTDAGRQLGLSSSAVGKAVARLEDRLGVRLFHRSTRSITVTQEGKIFFESCQRIFAEMKTIEAEFARTTKSPKGKLRVSLPLVGMLTMPAVSRFMRAYPDIELDMDFTDHLVDVIDGGYDVVVRSGEVCDSRLMSRRLGTYRLVLVASPEYLARAGFPSTPSDLPGHACLHRRYPTSGKLQRWPLRASAASTVALPTTAAASTLEPLVSMAELCLGIACVPDFAVCRQIADGTLVSVLGDYIDHIEAFRALWPASRYPSPKLRVFIDFLAEHLLPRASSMRDANVFVAGDIARRRDVSPLAELLTMRCEVE
jgi:DNA-binding transcriptional LysR family regulator